VGKNIAYVYSVRTLTDLVFDEVKQNKISQSENKEEMKA